MARLAQIIGLIVFGVGIAVAIMLLVFRDPALRYTLTNALAPCTIAPGDWEDAATLATGMTVTLTPCIGFTYKDEPDPEFRNFIVYNNFGFHDDDFTFDKPQDTYRILLLGDSFAQGNEVVQSAGFPDLIEKALDADSQQRVEVVNLGLQTLNTGGELLLYTALGWRFDADLVMLAFYPGNDVLDNYFANRMLTLDDSGALVMYEAETQLDPARFPDSTAYQWLIDQQAGADPDVLVFESLGRGDELGLYLPDDAAWSAAWRLTEALVLQLRDLVQAQGSDFAVVIIPDRRAIYRDYQAVILRDAPDLAPQMDFVQPHRRAWKIFTDAGIPTLDLQPILSQWAGNHPGTHIYYRQDGHFNPDGHALVAEQILHWLPSPPP